MTNIIGKILITLTQLIVAVVLSVLLVPPQWWSDSFRLQLSEIFGTPDYIPASENQAQPLVSEIDYIAGACPEDLNRWRDAQQIEGVSIAASEACLVDDPNSIAAFVRGTNNVSQETLLAAGLTPDAVEKNSDLDGDGDPDEIHIRLEVVELNGASPDSADPVTQFEIAPGITPGLWVFAPKSFGMATENFDSNQAKLMLRSPSPTIRIEQGDTVKITLENSHYLPHTMHFHGVDHAFLDESGEGNDGVPVTSELPVKPGSARTYEMQPRQAGTMFYHCHVQVQVHVMMGLQGMFVVEENRPDNWLQTLNVGAGHVRASSVAVNERYDREYDLQFSDLDLDLNNLIQTSNDPRQIEQRVNRVYDITDATSDFYTLNGKSFPYTFLESLVITQPDELIKLRVLNAGSTGLALHTHGHKTTATHYDGVSVPPAARITRDVFWLASAQRTDLELDTRNDGLHSYGSGVWLLHDHQQRSVTNDGLGPGGNLGAIVYDQFLGNNGWPTTYGEDINQYFDPSYYLRSPANEIANTKGLSTSLLLRLLALGLVIGWIAYCLHTLTRIIANRPT
jgi:hypothetical protein